MARFNHVPLKQLTRFTDTSDIDDQSIKGAPAEVSTVQPLRTSSSRWAACKNLLIRAFDKRKQHHIDQAAYRQLMRLDDNSLNDIGVTFDLQTPGDHRLRVVTTYKVAGTGGYPNALVASDYCISGQTGNETNVPLQKTDSLRWTDCVNFPVRLYRAKKQQLIDRAAFRELLKLDDSLLKDIGISREDVIRASRQSVFVSASLELEKIARHHCKN